jgi:O-antigen ligase
MEPRFEPLNETRSSWAFALMVGGVCLGALAGTVIAIRGDVAEYPESVVRLLLLCSSIIFISLLFRPDAQRLDRKALPALVFAAVACLSVFASPGFFSSLAQLELYFSIVAFGVAICLALRHCVPGIGKAILLAIGLVHAAFLLIALQFAMAAVGDPDPVAAPPFFMNVRHFGYQGFFGASAAVAVALADNRLRLTGVLLATAALFGIIMFGGRGALLAWILFVITAVGLVPNRRALLMVSLGSIAGAFALAVVAEQNGWLNTFSLLDRTRTLTGDTLSALYVQDRLEIWRDSLTAIAQRPILGFGPGGYQISGCCNPNVVQPHNSVLQVLLEFGVLGLVVLVWAGFAVLGPRIREIVVRTPRSKRNPIESTVLAILTGFAGFSLIDGLLFFPVPLVNFSLICAILLASAAVTPQGSAVGRAAIQSPTSSPDT